MITLISDLDGTLLGDSYGQHAFYEFVKPVRQEIFLIYATGRDMNEFVSAVNHEGLLRPDAAIINTGSDILIPGGTGFKHNTAWHKKIGLTWHKERVENALKTVAGISEQTKSNEYKLSYYVDALEAEKIRENASRTLSKAGLGANVILSHGIYMDVLPEGCDKGEAAKFLLAHLGRGSADVIVAGDSENDIDLFRKFSKGIVVGNALPGLKDHVDVKGFYHAAAHYGEGVVEGLKYYLSEMKK